MKAVQSPKSRVQSRRADAGCWKRLVFSLSFATRPSAKGERVSRPRHASGFTLMEAILALSISAVVMTAIGGIFFAAQRLRDQTTDMVLHSKPLARVFEVMRNDLAGATPPQGIMANTFRNGQVITPNGQDIGLQFCTTTGMMSPDMPWGDLQMVTYVLRDPMERDNIGGRDLIRSLTRNLLTTTANGTATATANTMLDAEDHVLMKNVASFDCYCFNGYSWISSWDSTLGDTNLPVAVRFVIRMAGETPAEDAAQQPYQLVVPLVIQPMTGTNTLSPQSTDTGTGTGTGTGS